MVEVFKTNIIDQEIANVIIKSLQEIFPEDGFNFDLEDCDKIFRVSSEKYIDSQIFITFLKEKNYFAEVLDD